MPDIESQPHYLTDELHRVMSKFIEERGLSVGDVVGTAKRAVNSFSDQMRLRQHELVMERLDRGEVLGPDAPEWEIVDGSGWTVAHYAVSRCGLPEGFNKWDMTDRKGWSVAHEAAAYGRLPEGFAEWNNIPADDKGRKVIDVAIEYGHDPFARVRELMALARTGELFEVTDWTWDMADEEGWTLAHEYVSAGRTFPDGDFKQWGLTDIWGNTVAHIAAENGVLPEDFDEWALSDADGASVAHYAAEFGTLPSGFDQWDLKGTDGKTVREVYDKHSANPVGPSPKMGL
jgi:hypothetical protein